ncbi:IS21-like element helper ATPase IstB [Chitinophaga filiformis]|uniref:IS21-like element helper ATPase IstB n=1 Tax=Chitinophaga filiformis TaxID=104663 RepID=A0ABY4I0W6_CHIFI|nr:IS21-like element helper ATPase IstB [Chitinophaga filiformis]UPK69695.1 IS21-like element helper ATPase IstB [Chitinophaga filiformis]UPK69723.1 IS21-like element helper ATPase IstB [Chitinophaga filiformis]UPK72457.1 IS21-like element helper ATPase IstB [Chitinophaga filiformis]
MQEVIKQKLGQMKLHGMNQAYSAVLSNTRSESITHDEFIHILVQAEWEDREGRKIGRSLKNARFRYQASIEEIDFTKSRNLDKTHLLRLAECIFIKKKEDLLITGASGVGKSFVASALGHQGCQLGYRVLYFNTQKLFSRLKTAKGDGSYNKEVSRIEKYDLLILDDFALQPLDNYNRNTLMEIIEDRHGRKSTIIASQLPVSMWYDVIGESTIADAILDRLVHKAHRIELQGESMRKLKSN